MLIKWLKEVKKEDGLIDLKIADIAELYNAGFPVPYGFCVTHEANCIFLEKTKIIDIISEAITNTKDIPKIAEGIKRLILETEIPEEIKTAIKNAYDSLDIDKDIYRYASKAALEFVKAGRSWPYVAVRDKNAVLNIKSIKDILNAIKICWASMFTVEALTQLKSGLGYKEVLTTVLVQKMVNTEKSGIVFSRNQEIIIEAAFGFNEIFSEETKLGQYVIDKNLKIKSVNENEQEWFYVREENLGKTIKRKLPREFIGKRVLDNNEIKYLAKCLMGIEKYYSSPKIVEWASEAGRIFVLQIRPFKIKEDAIKEPLQEDVQRTVIGNLHLVKFSPASSDTAYLNFAKELIEIARDKLAMVQFSSDLEVFRQECKAVKIALSEVKCLWAILPQGEEHLKILEEESLVPSENFRILREHDATSK